MAGGQSWAAFSLPEALSALLSFPSSLPTFGFPFTIIVIFTYILSITVFGKILSNGLFPPTPVRVAPENEAGKVSSRKRTRSTAPESLLPCYGSEGSILGKLTSFLSLGESMKEAFG